MEPAYSDSNPPTARLERERRAARRRWLAAVILAGSVHVAITLTARVQVAPKPRVDAPDPRLVWVGDKLALEEDTLQGQQLFFGRDDPLFLPTSQNFASRRRVGANAQQPGEIFASYPPVLVMPVKESPPGIVVAPSDVTSPRSALQRFRWAYLSGYGRSDATVAAKLDRRARIEARPVQGGAVALSQTLPFNLDRETPEATWPDWRPFGLLVTISDAGQVSEPIMLGGGSGFDRVDQFMRDYVGRRMRLDLRLPPGTYRFSIGP